MVKTAFSLFIDFFHPILFVLAGNEVMHEISVEFEIRPDLIIDCVVGCP